MPYLRTIIFCLIGLVLTLQYALWFGKSNVVDLINKRVEAIEARAREQLGLIKPGETYYQVVLPDDDVSPRDGS